MLERLAGTALCLLALPAIGPAQEKSPDRHLPAGTQLYLQWDGFGKHQAAYAKTAIAKTMKGDLGRFIRAALRRAEAQGRLLLAGQPNGELVGAILDDVCGILETVSDKGFTLGVELHKLAPVDAELVAVLPGAARGEKSFPSLMTTLLKLAQQEAKEEQVGERKVKHLDGGPVHLVWWDEGGDAVIAFGTRGPRALADKGKRGLTGRKLYQQVHGFEEFPTWARGYIDLAGLAKVVGGYRPEAKQLLDDLGLGGLKSLTFYSGFDGPAELGLLQLDLQGPRKGLLRLFSKQKFTLADLPPLPPDVNSFSADSLDLGQLYPVVRQAAEGVVRLFAPDQAPQVARGFEQAENVLGVKFNDLFEPLGNMVVQYSAWPEGPFGLGQVTLVKVKEPQKFADALQQLVQGLGNVSGGAVTVKASKYRGVQLNQVQVSGPARWVGLAFGSPTYALHEGWLVLSVYPQPVQGFILRARGELPAWKPGPKMEKRLAAFPKEMTSISISDPRPALKVLLSVLPAAVSALNGLASQFGIEGLDVGLIPNAYEATRHLFPNISVTTDEGNRIRAVSRTSLPLVGF